MNKGILAGVLTAIIVPILILIVKFILENPVIVIPILGYIVLAIMVGVTTGVVFVNILDWLNSFERRKK